MLETADKLREITANLNEVVREDPELTKIDHNNDMTFYVTSDGSYEEAIISPESCLYSLSGDITPQYDDDDQREDDESFVLRRLEERGHAYLRLVALYRAKHCGALDPLEAISKAAAFFFKEGDTMTNCRDKWNGHDANGFEPRYSINTGKKYLTWHRLLASEEQGPRFNSEHEAEAWIKAAPLLPSKDHDAP